MQVLSSAAAAARRSLPAAARLGRRSETAAVQLLASHHGLQHVQSLWGRQSQPALRCFATVAQPAAGPGDRGGSSSSSSSDAPPKSKFKQGFIILFKSLGLWAPAAMFWASLAWGAPLFDLRTDEEIQDDQHEVQRLERFFDIDDIHDEAAYVAEWTAKEEALSQVMDKLLKSSVFMDALKQGLVEETASTASTVADAAQVSWSPSRKTAAAAQTAVEAAVLSIEVSYVLPPVGNPDDEEENSSRALNLSGGPRTWQPRIIVSHSSGAMALLMLGLEHIEKGKDREERWTCTKLRAELLAGPGGEALGEPLCDLIGHAPHGVRYMRI